MCRGDAGCISGSSPFSGVVAVCRASAVGAIAAFPAEHLSFQCRGFAILQSLPVSLPQQEEPRIGAGALCVLLALVGALKWYPACDIANVRLR